ncbi:MAG: hypothetical protein MI867_02255, partial [Pseudomonadales bacterium]|nr:hypothetical protein [Pseudomonadales bacterium]
MSTIVFFLLSFAALTDPPSRIGQWSAEPYTDIIIVDQVALVAGADATLTVFDLTNPAEPMPAGSVPNLDVIEDDIKRLARKENRLYMTVPKAGLAVFDITQPALPVSMGMTETPGRPSDILIAGNYLFLAEEEAGLTIWGLDDSNR